MTQGCRGMRVGVVPFPLGARFGDLVASWRAAEEAGFDALWTIDHATPADDLEPAWDAPTLLVAMAAQTNAIPIGVLVFDVLLRHPFQLAGGVAVAQALSGGRVRVGFGVGDSFSRPDHTALQLPFPPFAQRVAYLEACCAALPALWRGLSVTDPVLGMDGARLGPVDIDLPEVIIGGANPALMKVAARHADAWNIYTEEVTEFAARADALADVEHEAGRSQPLPRSVYLFEERIGPDLRARLAAFERAGAQEAMLVLLHPTRDSVRELARRAL